MDRNVTAEWKELEAADMVRMRVEEDCDWGPDIFGDESRADVLKAYKQTGAWGVISEYRATPDGEWEHADSIWGMVGYRDVLDPEENPYWEDLATEAIYAARKIVATFGI